MCGSYFNNILFCRVYCDYHRHREFPTREEKLLHFLKQMSSQSWQWKEQYPTYPNEDYTEGNVTCW